MRKARGSGGGIRVTPADGDGDADADADGPDPDPDSVFDREARYSGSKWALTYARKANNCARAVSSVAVVAESVDTA